jgi:hypothetical protein
VAALTTAGYFERGPADSLTAHGRWADRSTWVVTINLIFAGQPPSTPAMMPAIQGDRILDLGRGGTLTETNSNAILSRASGPGHGYWEQSGKTSYQFDPGVHTVDMLPPFRYRRGYQRLDQTLEMQSADEFTTSGLVRFFAELDDDPNRRLRQSSGVRLY